MISNSQRAWSSDDVPPGPYFHGTRTKYDIGDELHTDVVSNIEGAEGHRLRCFVTTSERVAFSWAARRGLNRGDVLYVHEVDVFEPEVDVNMDGQLGGARHDDVEIDSVMALRAVVRRLHATASPTAFYEDDWSSVDYPTRPYGAQGDLRG